MAVEMERTDDLLTVGAGVELYGFSPRLLQRRVALGGFPGAHQVATEGGTAWVIPARTFAQLGYRPARQPGASRRTELPAAAQDISRSHEDEQRRRALDEQATVVPPPARRRPRPQRDQLQDEQRLERERLARWWRSLVEQHEAHPSPE